MNLTKLVDLLAQRYPEITFKESPNFYWSPRERTVHYSRAEDTVEACWSLLHETGHAREKHKKYYSDFELIRMESEAWEQAKIIASELGVQISEDHIQDCLDSYRDWLHKRCLCPACSLSGVQIDQKTYTCVFCHKNWTVSKDLFCRPYRQLV